MISFSSSTLPCPKRVAERIVSSGTGIEALTSRSMASAKPSASSRRSSIGLLSIDDLGSSSDDLNLDFLLL